MSRLGSIAMKEDNWSEAVRQNLIMETNDYPN
jgi:hypothetical protein